MKTRYIPIIFGLVLVAILLWWRSHRPTGQETRQPTNIEAKQSNLPPTQFRQVQTSVVSTVAATHEPTPESDFPAWNEKRMKEMKEGAERAQEAWRTPIEFYGRVVDENTNSVAGAQVDFDCNDTSADGTSFYHTQSDASGLFSIKDIKGYVLGVNVGKDGYYPYLPSGANFYYANQNQNFVPDPGNPVVFRLWKKGTGEALIHFDKSFPVPKDGTPLLIDLATGNITTSSKHAFKVECLTRDTEKKEGWKYDWNCRVSVPSGGLQTNNDQFPFLAPDENYVANDGIDMTVKPVVLWTQDVKRNYYIRTGDGKYARTNFRMIAHGEHFCELNYYFNPSGSRNLEPQ